MDEFDKVPVVHVKSHKKKGPVKSDDGTEKPFITFYSPPGGVWISATS